ncbi:prolipoprotein diacylglyceryl transferase [Pseudochrobactrum asaccharolyticum]|uniref:Phosphatidylglycerol--prolipoprotein diacylglyceryl transferase n=1 Tax=Pseudochrobactrum asaccharolyticum TaxID=354351 RepID=A0A366DZ34_9HYPH|nr:prolipoprotein diacylglyceryl transferase [Pseudochrobactrum asaccharolyticum]RBO94799.1 prolipoprotein diacylglyceryl transferase [Pseudochrobactrum asaccharolyticum]
MTEPQIMMAALPFPNIDPVLFSVGPLSVHWYGIGYVIGILFAWWYGKRLVNNARLWPNNNAPMDPLALDDFVLWAALGVVIGGRIGYVLFYNFSFYISNPLEIPAVWDGGMSFHGGILGTTVAMILFAKKRGIPVWSMFDTIAAGVPIGLGVVRIANFINSELWGRVSDVSWAVYFPNGGPLPRHPSQLYEAALEGFVLFFVLALLIWKGNKLKAPGFIAGAFVAGYGLSRILVEFFREPDAQLGYLVGGWMTMGMVLSVPMVLLGVWAMARANRAAAKA